MHEENKRTEKKALGNAKFKFLRKEVKTAELFGETLGDCGSWKSREWSDPGGNHQPFQMVLTN